VNQRSLIVSQSTCSLIPSVDSITALIVASTIWPTGRLTFTRWNVGRRRWKRSQRCPPGTISITFSRLGASSHRARNRNSLLCHQSGRVNMSLRAPFSQCDRGRVNWSLPPCHNYRQSIITGNVGTRTHRGSDLYNFGIVQFWTDTISAQRHHFAMKLLNIVPALIVVIVVVVLSFRRNYFCSIDLLINSHRIPGLSALALSISIIWWNRWSGNRSYFTATTTKVKSS
jgi:hypothetical protein